MTRVGCPKGISWHFRKTVSPQEEKSFSYDNLLSQPTRPRWMKNQYQSVQVPALKDLLDRPLDLETVELQERAMRDAGVVGGYWSPIWIDDLRSLKRHGSSPECVLDLLCFFVEHLKAARSALQEAIGRVELAVKKGERDFWQVAPWLGWCPCLGSKALPILRAMDARASILMTRLEEEAEKENHTTCLQEVALNSIGILFCRCPNDKD